MCRLWGGFKGRWKAVLVWAGCGILAVEIIAIGLAVNKLATYGVPADVARQSFYLTRYTLNLVLDTPTIDKIETTTNTRYTGFDQGCNGNEADSLLGWRNKKGQSCSFLYPTGGVPNSAGLMWNAYDQDGFMVSELGAPRILREKPDDVFRIIMLGGSALAGFGSPPLETISAHTLQILKKRFSASAQARKIEVINAGVGGFNLAQQYLYLMSELVYYRPDVVVFYNGWTESINRHGHFSDATSAQLRKRKKFKKVPFSSLRSKRHREYSAHINRSYTPKGSFVIFKNALSRSLGRAWEQTGTGYWTWKLELRKKWKGFWKGVIGLFRKSEQRPSMVEALKSDYDPRTLRVYEENINRSAALVKLWNIKGLFVLQPIIGVDGKTYSPEEKIWSDSEIGQAKISRRRLFYKHARGLLQQLGTRYGSDKGLCFADISGSVQNITGRAYVDEGHLNSKGNRAVAETIVDRLENCGYLKF